MVGYGDLECGRFGYGYFVPEEIPALLLLTVQSFHDLIYSISDYSRMKTKTNLARLCRWLCSQHGAITATRACRAPIGFAVPHFGVLCRGSVGHGAVRFI